MPSSNPRRVLLHYIAERDQYPDEITLESVTRDYKELRDEYGLVFYKFGLSAGELRSQSLERDLQVLVNLGFIEEIDEEETAYEITEAGRMIEEKWSYPEEGKEIMREIIEDRRNQDK